MQVDHLETMGDHTEDMRPPELETLATSTYRAWAHALGIAEPDFDKLSIAEQERWFRYAKDYQDVCPTYEGMKVDEVCRRFFGRYPTEKELGPLEKLAQQVIIRHLTILIDAADQLRGDYDGQERFWRGWTEERLRKLVTETTT